MTEVERTLLVIVGVFAGLIVLIQALKFVRAEQDRRERRESAGQAQQPAAAPALAITNRSELVAVVASCLAEVMGRDVSGLRIVSIKRVQ